MGKYSVTWNLNMPTIENPNYLLYSRITGEKAIDINRMVITDMATTVVQ
jgi:hypothetical protein